jgi:hypothetical protein
MNMDLVIGLLIGGGLSSGYFYFVVFRAVLQNEEKKKTQRYKREVFMLGILDDFETGNKDAANFKINKAESFIMFSLQLEGKK